MLWNADCVWAKGRIGEYNDGLLFVYKSSYGGNVRIRVGASNVYKLYVGGRLIGAGPARAAGGYARIDDYTISIKSGEVIAVEVISYGVKTYYDAGGYPFFTCIIDSEHGKIADSHDFECYYLNDRVKKVQRYSVGRGFAEVYRGYTPRSVRTVAFPFALIETENVKSPSFLPRECPYPLLKRGGEYAVIQSGRADIVDSRPLWRDRSLNDAGVTIEGFLYDELEEKISDTASKLVYKPSERGTSGYILLCGERVESGFVSLDVTVRAPCEIYVLFDELLINGEVNFGREGCCNVIKYSLSKPGKYYLTTAETYCLKYAKIVYFGGSVAVNDFYVIKCENPEIYNTAYTVADRDIDTILTAAQHTLAQNSADIFTDCTSRSKAGWYNCSYFTARAAALTTGNRMSERSHIENLLNAEKTDIPAGMLPMCYPAASYGGEFSPTCAMWGALEALDYIRATADKELSPLVRKKTYALIKYFDKFVNRAGLLENLDGWVFVDWSSANSPEHTEGVNYPANMLFYELINKTAKTYSDIPLQMRAEDMKNVISKQAFNGKYFEDNAVRRGGKLCKTGNVSEACQYYAFYFGIADKEAFPSLYNELFVKSSAQFDEAARANIIPGLIMREAFMAKSGLVSKVFADMKKLFLVQSQVTGTLWEYIGAAASCNHGITSFCFNILFYALTGGRVEGDSVVFDDIQCKIDCEFALPYKTGILRVRVSDGERTVEMPEE